MGCDHWRGEMTRSHQSMVSASAVMRSRMPAQTRRGCPAAGEAELPEFPGVAVVVVDGLIYGAGVDLADPVVVDRRCDVAEQPGQLRLW